jgi:hypothetical protein
MSATGMMLPGDGSNPPENDNLGPAADKKEDQASTATVQSAYVAPTDGQPTICQNCMHFDGQGMCDHPEVIADPEVQGRVDPNGHSKFYMPGSAESAERGMGAPKPQKKPMAGAGQVSALGAGARFPKVSNTPNYQGD